MIDMIKQNTKSYEWLNTALSKVYLTMGAGLFVTFLVALSLSTSPVAMAEIFTTWIKWPVLLAPLAFVFAMSFGYDHFQARTLLILFYAFSVLQGLSLSAVFLIYTSTSLVSTLLICSLLFVAMSVYGYFTKRSLDSIGGFLTMALIGLIIAMVVNIFMQSTVMVMVISVVGVLLFLALTAYDTQRIKNMLWGNSDQKKAIVMGSLTLYLDFLNLFMFLLNLLGVKTTKD